MSRSTFLSSVCETSVGTQTGVKIYAEVLLEVGFIPAIGVWTSLQTASEGTQG